MTTPPTMKLNSRDLEGVTDMTLQHYDERAESFREGTHGHDVSQNIAALLQHIEGNPPSAILDLGCGPGRDLKTFVEARSRPHRPGRFRAFRRNGARRGL